MARQSDKPLRNRVAAHVRRIVHERGWTQAQFAREVEINSGAASRLLSGDRTVGLDVFAKLHWKLGLDANTLLDVDPLPTYFDTSATAKASLESAVNELVALSDAANVPPELAGRLRTLAAMLRRKGVKGGGAK